MGRVKYRGKENHFSDGSTASTINHGSNNNDYNIKNNGFSNGKHRNGGPKRRGAKVPGSQMDKSSSLTSGKVVFSILVAFLFSVLFIQNCPSAKHFFLELYAQVFRHNFSNSGIQYTHFVPSSGGWRLASENVLRNYDSGRCTIERVSVTDLPPERFELEFRFKKPVLVSFPSGASDWTDPEKWSRDSLVKEYSKWTIRSGESLDIVRKGGNAKHRSSFLTFVDQLLDNVSNGSDTDSGEPMNYAFDRHFYWHTKLPKTLKLPEYFRVNRTVDDSIFFLGSSLTGVVFHKHSDTWNGVIYGRKRWFLYPTVQTPPGGVHHGYTVLEWVNNVYPNLTESQLPIECVQEPGEILYLPEGTYHATLNLGDTIALAIQKKQAQLETEILFYEATNLVNLIHDDPPENLHDERTVRLLEVYEQLHNLLPGNAEVMMKLGDMLLEMKEYEESLPWHQMAIEQEPYFILAYIHLGKTYEKLKRYEEAEEQYLNAKARSPNFWDIYKEYGEFLFKQGRVGDALSIYKRGTELKPDLMPFWYYYKTCQEQVGDEEGAKATAKIMDKLRAEQKSQK